MPVCYVVSIPDELRAGDFVLPRLQGGGESTGDGTVKTETKKQRGLPRFTYAAL
jgi:hypothetical protein